MAYGLQHKKHCDSEEMAARILGELTMFTQQCAALTLNPLEPNIMPTFQRTAIATILRQLAQGFLSQEEAAKAIKETYFPKG